MNNEEQRKYFEQVEQFVEFAKKSSEELEKVSNNISGLSDRLVKLKSIEELNTALLDLDKNIDKINSCTTSLKSVFSDINSLETIKGEIHTVKNMFDSTSEKLKTINDDLDKVVSTTNNLNLSQVDDEINNVNKALKALNEYINSQLITAINDGLNNNIKNLTTEVETLKTAFNEYKKEAELQIQNLSKENNEIKNEFKNIITSNNEIINLFKQMKETNTDVEKYMDEFIKKWYDSNVGVFGRRKKDN